MRRQAELPTPYIIGFDLGEACALHDELVAVTRRAFFAFSFGDTSTIEADQKSIALLKEWLTPEQLKDFEQKEAFEVIGNATGKRYRIHKCRSFGVYELGRGHDFVYSRLCLVPENALAYGDIMLAQKIMLETNEVRALAIANRTA